MENMIETSTERNFNPDKSKKCKQRRPTELTHKFKFVDYEDDFSYLLEEFENKS